MLKDLHVLLIGGDARYLEIIDKLVNEGVKVYLIGYDQLSFNNPNIINSKIDKINFKAIDAIILPVAGTDTAGEVEAIYSDNTVYLSEEMLIQTPEHCIIYTGTTNSFLNTAVKSANRKLIVLFDRDDIAIFNSIPTAEGALNLAIEETDFTIHGANVMVLGFGRVGFTVARLFDSVGANVSVAARRPSAIARIKEMGLTSVKVSEMEQEITDMAICINTIPQQILNEKVISAMDKSALIIDLASKPGGMDFAFAKKKGVKAIHALGMPGKTAPKTAGRIIGEVLLELLKEIEKTPKH
ncbi:dipicolinic acid synthetase subunit A [Virgibacillus profundi]|uniref:Dipicolinic acid synthetase subunit A n=1 Tax=Virgibacillus profundi TaxID=2024555 RepID=A0A2A2IBU5_9BACI|nr:dipicolinate synthase subunit DpsA [Virgibacillus profundi]PAV28848.1 dipicolinic acid synthetase subunit A [Virgibacillus profundi]PXY53016.1 dipicolinate synthase subunit DpsA [Virgibacillus profundi]